MIPRSKKFAISTFLQYLIKTILYLITCSTYCFAQTGRSAVHEIPRSVIERVQTASIKMFGIDSLSGQQNSAPFSGVIVRSDGSILTVAHATRPGNFYRVIFADGKQGVAKALGRLVVDQQSNLPDIAMMKMQGQGPWPYAEMGWSSSITENQLCFGLSYPETLPFNIPFLRTGSILKKLDNFGFIQSSSIMEPGDSGGPLFDALGRVIGLHSRIDGAEGINFEVPINSYRSYWQSLTNPVAISSYPVSTDSIGKDPQQKKLIQLGIKKPAKHPKTNFQPIQISSTLDGDSILLLGTAFNLGNNKQVILSKSSLIGEAPIVKIANRIHVLRILLRDEKSDLVALISDHQFPSVDVSKVARQSISDSFVGLNLWSLLGADQRKFGVLGMSSQTFPRLPVPGTFDAQMQEIEGLPTLTKVDSTGAAARAGLRVGDRMLTLNNRDVSSAIKINAAMQQFSAGDTLQVQYRRGAADLYTNVILSNWSVRENPHPANNIPKGKSVRRDNFLRVFLHDSRIHADECGSPVVDSKGNFIGLNIARFSHTACLAISRDTILAFLSTVEHML
ncbi:trypsin-like peptidase domain-containing protein [Sphingobacterium siyangense]|uniref:trypsin-like peptidase domain-containing protein n=1 Tax=Sphingobacterium siyangense TaxID=459529 RepID=UPI003C749AAF